MHVGAPPTIESFEDLKAFQDDFTDAIIVAIDVENVDHLPTERSALSKLSEVGLAWVDMRACQKFENNAKEIIRRTVVRHGLVWKWRWVTADSCPYHKNRPNANWDHTAEPYLCQFTRSITYTSAKSAMDNTFERIKQFPGINRTKEEISTNTNRKVMVIFWSSFLEEKTFIEAGWSGAQQNQANTFFYDFQKLSPVVDRWKRQGKSQAPCCEVIRSLGLTGLNYHNAGNDAFVEVAGMVRFLTMTKAEYDSWTAGGQLSTIDMPWINPAILAHNKAQGVRAVQRGRPVPRKK